MNYREYGIVTVLINTDEEISSPGSRNLISKLGAEHDAIFSLESSRAESDKLSLATSGIASVTLTVQGVALGSGAGKRHQCSLRARASSVTEVEEPTRRLLLSIPKLR